MGDTTIAGIILLGIVLLLIGIILMIFRRKKV